MSHNRPKAFTDRLFPVQFIRVGGMKSEARITGWAQGQQPQRHQLEENSEYDVWYVDHLSFRLDR